MNEPQIVAADEVDLRALAQRRWPDDASRRLYIELAQAAARGAWVARDEGTPVGIAFAHELESEWFISDLYVEPSFRRAGLGRKLLAQATDDRADVSLAGVIDAADADSLAFLLRRGIGLHVPVLRVFGEIPREEALLRMAAGDYRFQTMPIEPRAHHYALDALDRDVRATARPNDHLRFTRAATGTAFYINDECVGYAYVWPDGRIGPLAAASGAYLVQFFAFALESLRRTYRASWCMALIPGTNIRILRAAVRSGMSVDQLHIFASDQPQIDLSRYIGFHALAF